MVDPAETSIRSFERKSVILSLRAGVTESFTSESPARKWKTSAPAPPVADAAALQGRVLARAVPAGQPLRAADLQARQWFAAGDVVRVVTSGAGFSVATEGRALAAGIEGQAVRVRIGENHLAAGRPVGPRTVEVGL